MSTHTHTGVTETTVVVTPGSVGFIIGNRGKTVNLIKKNTGAWVQIRTELDSRMPPSFQVRGFPHQVDEAVKWINTIVDEAESRGPPPVVPSHSVPSLTGRFCDNVTSHHVPQHHVPHVPQFHVPQFHVPQFHVPQFHVPHVPQPPIHLAQNQVWMVTAQGVPFVYTIPGDVDRTPEEAENREDVRCQEEIIQRDPGYIHACEFTGAEDVDVISALEADQERENLRVGFGGTDWSEVPVVEDWGAEATFGC
jgi:hypothetical protein